MYVCLAVSHEKTTEAIGLIFCTAMVNKSE